MKAPQPQEVGAQIRSWIHQARNQRLFRDKLSLSILIPTLVLNVAVFLVLFFRLRPANFQVPSHYSNLTGFDSLAPWYQAYNIALFGLFVTGVNTVLAVRSFGYSRITSFFLMAGSFVVALFCLIIGTAFAVIV